MYMYNMTEFWLIKIRKVKFLQFCITDKLSLLQLMLMICLQVQNTTRKSSITKFSSLVMGYACLPFSFVGMLNQESHSQQVPECHLPFAICNILFQCTVSAEIRSLRSFMYKFRPGHLALAVNGCT